VTGRIDVEMTRADQVRRGFAVGRRIVEAAVLGTVALFAAAALIGGDAQAQPAAKFPSKALRIVVPFGAGGIADLTARTVAEHMSRTLKQPVIIDNKPGAGGVAAAEAVARAEADGHTLLLLSNANAISRWLFKQLPYDPQKDFAPVGMLATFDLVIVAPSKAKFATFDDMVRYARANPGKLNIGTINIGSTQHLSAELFATTFGIKAQVVPFNGTPAVISALRGDQIDVAFEILGPMLPQIRAGAVHALAVTGATRDRALPQTRAVSEFGYGRFEVSSWNGLAVPAKTPGSAIAELNAALNAALQDSDVARRLRELHVEPRPGGPEALGRVLESDLARWGDVIARTGIPRQ
jgi:tripartite-type tricarboxylate transporter receptor subunit TctC